MRRRRYWPIGGWRRICSAGGRVRRLRAEEHRCARDSAFARGGAFPVRAGRGFGRASDWPPAQAVSLRSLLAVSSDEPDEGKVGGEVDRLSNRDAFRRRCGHSQIAIRNRYACSGKLSLRQRADRAARRARVGRRLQLLPLSATRMACRLLSAGSGAHFRRDDSLCLGRSNDRHSPLSNLRLRHPLAISWGRFRQDGDQCTLARQFR